MKLKSIVLAFFGVFIIGYLPAQQISWTGNIDKISLFNAANWLDEATGNALSTSISSSVPINRDIYFGSNATIGTDQEVKGLFDAGTGKITFKNTIIRTDYVTVTGFKSATSLTLDSAIVLTGQVDAPQITLSGNSQLHLYETNAITPTTKIYFVGENAWLFFHSLSPQQVIDKYASQFTMDGIASIVGSNVQIKEYYGGTVVIPQRPSTKALYLYSGANLTGVSKYFRPSYSTGNNIGANGTNKAASFILRKGYMATIAQNQDGTGPSKVYIAEDSDIIVNGNINGKNDTVMFVRVAPWRWITKKGIGGNFTQFGNDWYYNWGAGSTSTNDNEFVPMQWGTWAIDTNCDALKTKADVTHLLGFNEPDHKEQANMTVAQCLSLWPKLMATGLRLGSPSFTNIDSINKFMDRALALGYRVDFICLHNYDKRTGDNYVGTICKPLHDKYNIPIWVTEYSYGASWNTTTSDNALTYYNAQKDYTQKMNASPYVERYAVFTFGNPVLPTDSLFCSFEKFQSVLAGRGIFYRDYEGLPSRGNPLIYRAKIDNAKSAAANAITTVTYNNHCFSFLSRNNDGVSRRRIQISTAASSLNTAFMGGVSTGTGAVNEVFLMTLVTGNTYKLKVNNNCLTLSVRNDSVVVETENQTANQLWEMVAVIGTNYFGLKNVATGKYINPVNNNIAIGTLLTLISSADITQNKSAQWEPIASGICNCGDTSMGVFDMKVDPLSGNAPLTVSMSGSKLTIGNNDAFYRWYIFQGADTLINTFYQNQFTYTNPGNYRIQVRGKDLYNHITTKEFTVVVNAASGVENLSNSGVSIFPNPVGDEFQLKGISEGQKVSLYDVQGRLVIQTNYFGKSIHTNQLPSGFYILRCQGFAPLKVMKK
jgi:hypothetical protein